MLNLLIELFTYCTNKLHCSANNKQKRLTLAIQIDRVFIHFVFKNFGSEERYTQMGSGWSDNINDLRAKWLNQLIFRLLMVMLLLLVYPTNVYRILRKHNNSFGRVHHNCVWACLSGLDIFCSAFGHYWL